MKQVNSDRQPVLRWLTRFLRIDSLREAAAKLRDKTRYQLCADLCAIGLDARTVERDQPEEDIFGGWKGDSLGLIEVRESPIRWVNVLKHPESRYMATTVYTNVYLVPDTTVHYGNPLEIKSIPVKSAPLYGRVVDIKWTASSVGIQGMAVSEQAKDDSWKDKIERNLIRHMNEDVSLKESLLGLEEEIAIRSYPNWCWAISSRRQQAGWAKREPGQLALSREQWQCYQTIAGHLLASGGK